MAEKTLFYTLAHDALVSTTVDGQPVTFKVSEHKVGKPSGFRAVDGDVRAASDFDLSGVAGVTAEPHKCVCDKAEKDQEDTPSTTTRKAVRESAGSADDKKGA